MQLEIINILDEILQKKELGKLGIKISDNIFNSLQDPNTGRPLVKKINEFCNKNSSYTTGQIKSALETKLMDYVDYTAGVSIGAANGCMLTVCNDAGNYKYTTKELISKFDPSKFLIKAPLV